MKKPIGQALAGLLIVYAMAGHANIFVTTNPPIEGDVTAKGFEGAIGVNSASGSFAKDFCGEVEVTKNADLATAGLIAAAVSGETFLSITISYLLPSADQLLVYQTLVLNDAVVSSISTSGSEDERPEENILMLAESIELTYIPFDGTKQGPEQTVLANCEPLSKRDQSPPRSGRP